MKLRGTPSVVGNFDLCQRWALGPREGHGYPTLDVGR